MLTNVHCRIIFLITTATLTLSLTLAGQDTKRPILSSHDRIDGPLAGAYRVEDLQVFPDGRVVYTEEAPNKPASHEREKPVYRLKIGADEVRHLAELLDSNEIRSLPKSLPAPITPIDFFWQKSLEITRTGEIQAIEIKNFYPFINMQHAVYPKALIELECRLQDIKAAAAKRSNDENAWCQALLISDSRTGVPDTTTQCAQNSKQPKIISGEGWGPVRLGAPLKAVDAFLGKGQRGNRYKDVYFKRYPPKGVEVSFDIGTDTVDAIFFYHGQWDEQHVGLFCGETAIGVGWQSSIADVKNAYGKPTAEYSGADWARLVFDGIDFRFENGRMVRIGIPGK